jgi:hypothetical protein
VKLLPIAVLVISTLPPIGVRSQAIERAQTPQLYELYSWRSANPDVWYFALLSNTSRIKAPDEIFEIGAELKGVEALERRLSAVGRGSTIYWFGGLDDLNGRPLKGTERLAYPSSDIMDRIRRFASRRAISMRGDPALDVLK